MRRLRVIAVVGVLFFGLSGAVAWADPTPPPANDHNCEAVVGITYLPVTLGWTGYSHVAHDALLAGEVPAVGRAWAGHVDQNALRHANCGNHHGQGG